MTNRPPSPSSPSQHRVHKTHRKMHAQDTEGPDTVTTDALPASVRQALDYLTSHAISLEHATRISAGQAALSAATRRLLLREYEQWISAAVGLTVRHLTQSTPDFIREVFRLRNRLTWELHWLYPGDRFPGVPPKTREIGGEAGRQLCEAYRFYLSLRDAEPAPEVPASPPSSPAPTPPAIESKKEIPQPTGGIPRNEEMETAEETDDDNEETVVALQDREPEIPTPFIFPDVDPDEHLPMMGMPEERFAGYAEPDSVPRPAPRKSSRRGASRGPKKAVSGAKGRHRSARSVLSLSVSRLRRRLVRLFIRLRDLRVMRKDENREGTVLSSSAMQHAASRQPLANEQDSAQRFSIK